jgi:hypothetical protein
MYSFLSCGVKLIDLSIYIFFNKKKKETEINFQLWLMILYSKSLIIYKEESRKVHLLWTDTIR